MCLNLVNSKYTNMDEVEFLLDNEITENQIIKAKNSRKEIKRLIKLAESNVYLDMLGI